MSIELRLTVDGECICGQPYPTDRRPDADCIHRIECEFGAIEKPPLFRLTSDPRRITVTDVSPVILVAKRFADDSIAANMLEEDVTTFYSDGGRKFMRVAADNGTWTWELFDAHWEDGAVSNVYVGRWPD